MKRLRKLRRETMKLHDLGYPFRLCVEMLAFAGMSCEKTENMKASEIKEVLAVFFTEEDIEKAVNILTGNE